MTRLWWSARSGVFLLWMAVTVVPYALVVVFVSLFVRGAPVYAVCRAWLAAAVFGARIFCGVRHRIVHPERLAEAQRGGALVLLPKHQSAWEAIAFPALMPRTLCYVFKRELLYIPFFGWSMARMDMIHIDRGRSSEAWRKVLSQGKTMMARGHWVIMFPEGTRAPRGGQEEYKSGGTRLAVSAGVPVLPIAVNSARCWPRKSFMLRPGVIDVCIGPLMPSAGRKPDALMRDVETWIETEMRRIDPDAYPVRTAAPAAPADPAAPAAPAAGRAAVE